MNAMNYDAMLHQSNLAGCRKSYDYVCLKESGALLAAFIPKLGGLGYVLTFGFMN